MQGPIDTALTIVAAGNAFLRGDDVTGFWPHARTFVFSRSCEFRTPPISGDDWPLLASDPLAWFATLKPWCKGLRLHNAPHALQAGQLPGTSERMMVGFIGGGPRWLIEAKGEAKSQIWEGFQQLGNREAPDRKIWRSTFLMQGEIVVSDRDAVAPEAARARLAAVLPQIEAFAREIGETGFAGAFAEAGAALGSDAGDMDMSATDFARYGHVRDRRADTLLAIQHAWVFGGMGSWNDTGGGERYEELSEELFRALCDCVCGLANSTCS